VETEQIVAVGYEVEGPIGVLSKLTPKKMKVLFVICFMQGLVGVRRHG
jgi:hypothetical protein